ncbi:hypothetical protein [Hydrogenophaga sp. 5NK40-0174]|uniref:hypothetical protein n=1 Tax=Hydrogenophaga sp. 5NK40-0174 TaxID=3127649 RepID=UPI0031096D56
MHLIVIAWLYVVLMMAVAEATNSNGTVIGAIMTFVLYGLLPISILLYLLRTPVRRKTLRDKEAAERAATQNEQGSGQPDTGSHPPTAAEADSVPPVGKEPR